MPTYSFSCKICESEWDELCKFEEIGKFNCPFCKSNDIEKLITCGNIGIIFTNPEGTSKYDNFVYKAADKMAKAKMVSRAAKEAAGLNPDQSNHSFPYAEMNDDHALGKIVDNEPKGLS